MNASHFENQLTRLIEMYGKNFYPKERGQVIWREVKDLSDEWFTRTIDKFIGECRNAPLMPEFREEISRERERTWDAVKKQERRDTQQFLRDSYSNEEKQTICEMIRQIGSGGVEESETKSFISMLNNAANTKKGA